MSFLKSMRLRSLAWLGAVPLGIALWLALAAPAVAKPIEFDVSLINRPGGLEGSQPVTTNGACGFSSSPGVSVHLPNRCLHGLSFERNTIQQGGMLVQKNTGGSFQSSSFLMPVTQAPRRPGK